MTLRELIDSNPNVEIGQIKKPEVKKPTCCDNQRLMVDESFSYEVEWDEDEDKLFIYTNDYCTDGFQNLQCANCGAQFKLEEFDYE